MKEMGIEKWAASKLRYLVRFSQYSGFPCVVKSWRGIACNLSTPRPETWDLHAVEEPSRGVSCVAWEWFQHVPTTGAQAETC